MRVNDSMKDNNTEENIHKIHEIYLEGCEKCKAGDFDAGLTCLDKAISLSVNPKLLSHYYLVKASYLNEMGHFEEEIQMLEKSLKVFPENANTLGAIGIVYKNKAEYAKAATYFRKSLELEESFAIYSLLARCDLRTNNFEEAIKHAKKALELKPGWEETQKILETAQELLNKKS